MNTQQTTSNFYTRLENAYSFFNVALFNNELSDCLIVMNSKKNKGGHFAPERWVDSKQKKKHEIALNPDHFTGYKMVEVLQVLVHEMCHLWQQEYGKPSRNGYHNLEWAKKMLEVGLEPVSYDNPGKMTGQRVGDRLIVGGKFITEAINLLKNGFIFPLALSNIFVDEVEGMVLREQLMTEVKEDIDRDEDIIDTLFSPMHEVFDVNIVNENLSAKKKSKYQCSCGNNVWGKPGLSMICTVCNLPYHQVQ